VNGGEHSNKEVAHNQETQTEEKVEVLSFKILPVNPKLLSLGENEFNVHYVNLYQ
jgi:hypothetical protein